MEETMIFGAFASVCIRFDGTLDELADKLSTALNIGRFRVEPREHPPHTKIGAAEALGWELWLEAAKTEGEFDLRGETEHAFEEIFEGRMYDLSPWLARFLAVMCDLNVRPM